MIRARFSLASVLVVSMVTMPSTQPGTPTFEVVSVKKRPERLSSVGRPVFPLPFRDREDANAAVFYRQRTTVAGLIQYAFSIGVMELSGGPDWIRTDLFEINAKPAAPVQLDQMRLMVQSLLVERFQLLTRVERRERRHAELVVDRQDGMLGPNIAACRDVEAETAAPRAFRIPVGASYQHGVCRPISTVAVLTSAVLEMPVVDKTGLSGLWTYGVTFAALEPSPALADSEARPPLIDAPAFPAALREQLGIRIVPTVGPIDVVVIESVQQPTED